MAADPMHYPINGNRFVVWSDPIDGMCVQPSKHGLIYVCSTTRGRNRLETFIHEFMHADQPDREHKDLAVTAGVLAEILWNNGVRFKTTPQRRRRDGCKQS